MNKSLIWTIPLFLGLVLIFGLTSDLTSGELSALRNKFKTSRYKPTISWGNWTEYQPWPQDDECSVYKTRVAANGTLPLRALASFPGSGNTWTRFLTDSATGIYTGSIFSSGGEKLIKAGLHGEERDFRDGSTILQKTHHSAIYNPDFKKVLNYFTQELQWRKQSIEIFEGRGIVLVRNPYKAIMSYWTYYKMKSNTDPLADGLLTTDEFRDFAFVGIARWFELISDWIKYGKQVYFLFYEDLQDDPIQEMRNLLDYLGLPVDEGRISCLRKHNEGSFHRTKHKDTNPYSDDHNIIFSVLIKLAAEKIYSATGQILPIHKYKFYQSDII